MIITFNYCHKFPPILLSGGEYPAHAAAHEGNVELLGMLIHEGHCGVNDKDHMGATPAHKGAKV